MTARNMRRLGCLVVLAVALSAPWDVSAEDMAPRSALDEFIQQRGLGSWRLTAEEWCQLALLAMASPQANEQTRMAISDMARNQGCYTEALPSKDEQVRTMICKTIPALLFLNPAYQVVLVLRVSPQALPLTAQQSSFDLQITLAPWRKRVKASLTI